MCPTVLQGRVLDYTALVAPWKVVHPCFHVIFDDVYQTRLVIPHRPHKEEQFKGGRLLPDLLEAGERGWGHTLISGSISIPIAVFFTFAPYQRQGEATHSVGVNLFGIKYPVDHVKAILSVLIGCFLRCLNSVGSVLPLVSHLVHARAGESAVRTHCGLGSTTLLRCLQKLILHFHNFTVKSARVPEATGQNSTEEVGLGRVLIGVFSNVIRANASMDPIHLSHEGNDLPRGKITYA